MKIPVFTHHILTLLSVTGQQGAVVGTAHSSAVKAAWKEAGAIQQTLYSTSRVEVALIPPVPDLFDDSPGMSEPRNKILKLMDESQRLRFVVLTTRPESVHKVPRISGRKNLCIGVPVDGSNGLEEKLNALRSVRVSWRMLLLNSLKESVDLRGKLDGICWVVVVGTADNAHHADAVRAACMEEGKAFLWLDQDEPDGFHTGTNTLEQEGPSDVSVCPEHPFGPEVQLRRPTLRGLKAPTQLTLDLPPPESPLPATDEASAVVADGETTTKNPAPDVTDVTDITVVAGEDLVEMTPVEDEDILQSAKMEAVQEKTAPSVPDVSAAETVVIRVAPPRKAGAVLDVSQPDLRWDPILDAPCDSDSDEFRHLDEIVRTGVNASLLAGVALLQIRDRKLWKAGGYDSWNAYCEEGADITKQYANQLIQGALIVERIRQHQVETIVSTTVAILPQSPAQTREISRLKDPEKQIAVWWRGVELEGGQPTAKSLRGIVAEAMAEEDGAPQITKTTMPALTPVEELISHLNAELAKDIGARNVESLTEQLRDLLLAPSAKTHSKSRRVTKSNRVRQP